MIKTFNTIVFFFIIAASANAQSLPYSNKNSTYSSPSMKTMFLEKKTISIDSLRNDKIGYKMPILKTKDVEAEKSIINPPYKSNMPVVKL